MSAAPPQRIHIVGTSGAGKSTFGRRLSAILSIEHTEMDALHWGPGWAPREDFGERLAAVAAGDSWIVCGNYGQVAQSLLWPRAQQVIFLDFGRHVVWSRIVVRTLRRGLRRQVLWNGNVEPLWQNLNLFAGEGSVIWWSLTTFARRRREYAALFAQDQPFESLVLRRPKEAEAWLRALR